MTNQVLYWTCKNTERGTTFSSYKSEEMELILSFKNRIIQILMPKVITISQFTRSD